MDSLEILTYKFYKPRNYTEKNTNTYRYLNEKFKELLIPAKFDCERLGVKEFLNGLFLGLNEWLELWDFNGIISLFTFTEAEEVGFILWPMLVEK